MILPWLLAAPLAAAPVPAADAYEAAVAHRRAGRHAAAVQAFRAVLKDRPDHVDALVGLGLSLSALGERQAAATALRRSVELAPDYWDAHVGLARLAYAEGDLPAARARLLPVLAASPDHPDASALSDLLTPADPAGADPAALQGRLDLWAARSRLTAGLPPWREVGFALALPRDAATSLHLGAQATERFDQSDLYFEVGFRRRVGGGRAWGLSLGGAPDADHRPEIALAASVLQPVRPGVALTLDGAVSRYPTVQVASFSPGLEVAAGPRLTLSGRLFLVAPEGEDPLSGYGVRADLQATAATRLAIGWTDAPESSEGRPVPVQALSAAVARDLTDTLTLRLTGTHEDRPAYDRDEIALGAAVRF